MPRLLLQLTVILLSVLGVHAGSRQWEGSVRLQQPHPVTHIEIDASGHAVKDNATQNSLLEKRWVAITHRTGDGLVKRWPDKTISYCYNTIESRNQLHDYLIAATKRWQHAGLFADVYKYVQVAEPGTSCTGHPQRANILVISYNTDGILRTTLGIYPQDSDDEEFNGPYSRLSTRNDIGVLDAVANIAHELGHAWGLAHEHQNPSFWKHEGVDDSDNGGENWSDDGWTWSPAQFDCRALSDYERIHAQVRELKPDDVAKLCTSLNVARRYGFSALEWLPDSAKNLRRQAPGLFVDGGVDWQSIMLYPSRAGGQGPAAPPNEGEEMDANDGRSIVLKRRDGSTWSGNYHPSENDIAGIRSIYEDDTFPDGEPVLPIDEDHRHGRKFRALARKIKCKISGGE